jgi:hypothetical protein
MHRLSQGWSLDDVARQLAVLGYEFLGTRGFGVDGTMVGRWERGERRPRHGDHSDLVIPLHRHARTLLSRLTRT